MTLWGEGGKAGVRDTEVHRAEGLTQGPPGMYVTELGTEARTSEQLWPAEQEPGQTLSWTNIFLKNGQRKGGWLVRATKRNTDEG